MPGIQILLASLLAVMVAIQDGAQTVTPPSTQANQESSPIESSKQIEAKIQAEVAEIMAIRKQLGGGISEQLKGISIEMPHNTSPKTPAGNPIQLDEAFAEQLTEQSRNQTVGKKGEPPLSVPQPQSAVTSEQTEGIRQAARMLEEAAATLEKASQYQQADRIRQIAGDLWRAARVNR